MRSDCSRAADDHAHWATLAALALASGGIWWGAFTQAMWLPTFYFVPHLDTPKLLGVSTNSMASYAAIAFGELILYLAALLVTLRLRSRRSAVVILFLLVPIAVPLVLTYSGGAGDVYAYIAEADTVLRYGANPFHVSVAAIPGHPLLPFLDYPNETTHYGPLWIVMAVVLRLVAGPGLLPALIVFKVAAVAFLVGVAWLVYLTVRVTRPEAAIPAALLVAWNPLLVLELAQNAHNDVAMMLFIALAFYLQSRGKARGAIAALLTACLVKYVAAVLIPLFLLVDLHDAGPWRRWIVSTARDVAAVAAFGAALTWLVGFEGSIGILQRLSEWFTTSFSAAAYYRLVETLPIKRAAEIAGNAGKSVFAVMYIAAVARSWLRPVSLVSSSCWAVLALMAAGTTWFQPWYVTWAIPLVALLPPPLSYAAVAGMTVGGFMIHLIMGFAWRLDWNHGSWVTINAAGAVGMWLPVVAAVAIVFLFQTWTARTATVESALPGSTRQE